MVKIAIIGYGRMGQLIHKLAEQKGHKVVAIIDPACSDAEKEITKSTLKDAEVCIEFTHPSSVVDNIRKIAELGRNIVVGTTGWYNQIEEITEVVEKNKIGLIWSGNFSIGVNAFFRIVECASKIFDNLEDYDILVNEIHHNQKADSPSGTAEMIGKIILDNTYRKQKIFTEKLDRKIEPNELHISSTRGGNIPGTHTVMIDSPQDTIELKHIARNREGFAYGSVLAAEFIVDKKGIFNINDLMDNILKYGQK